MKAFLSWVLVFTIVMCIYSYPVKPSVTIANTINFFNSLESPPSLKKATEYEGKNMVQIIAGVTVDIGTYPARLVWYGLKTWYLIQKHFRYVMFGSGDGNFETKPPLITGGFRGGR